MGLGHQVVRRVAAVHGGTFETVDDAEEGTRSDRIALAKTAA
jgi:hypothetical protein